jgi:hypothetical protein
MGATWGQRGHKLWTCGDGASLLFRSLWLSEARLRGTETADTLCNYRGGVTPRGMNFRYKKGSQ